MKQRGFFDEDERLQELSAIGDPLERTWRIISVVCDFIYEIEVVP
jgi:hypothetical protein